jgi:hypothetical protein
VSLKVPEKEPEKLPSQQISEKNADEVDDWWNLNVIKKSF